MSIQRINVGPRLSDVAIHKDVAYFGGVVADDGEADIAGQMRDVLAQIDALLAQVGSDKSRILQCQIFLADLKSFAAMNAVWDAWVVPGCTPPRATVEARLANPQWKVEIVLAAAIG